MKKWLPILFLTLFYSCGIFVEIIGHKKWEKPSEYLVDPQTKPSQLIQQFTRDTSNTHKSYFLVFYTPFCYFCLAQMEYINRLHQQYKNQYHFIAITELSKEESKEIYRKMETPPEQIYEFQAYNNIWGLRSSLRNLYYQNDLTKLPDDGDPTNMIIKNDSIVYISDGGVIYEEVLHKYKEMLN